MAQITLNGNIIHTNGNIPGIESQAKDFILVDQELNDITLDFFKGKRKLFYTVPSLDTGVCAASTKKFSMSLTKSMKMRPLSLSPQTFLLHKSDTALMKM